MGLAWRASTFHTTFARCCSYCCCSVAHAGPKNHADLKVHVLVSPSNSERERVDSPALSTIRSGAFEVLPLFGTVLVVVSPLPPPRDFAPLCLFTILVGDCLLFKPLLVLDARVESHWDYFKEKQQGQSKQVILPLKTTGRIARQHGCPSPSPRAKDAWPKHFTGGKMAQE